MWRRASGLQTTGEEIVHNCLRLSTTVYSCLRLSKVVYPPPPFETEGLSASTPTAQRVQPEVTGKPTPLLRVPIPPHTPPQAVMLRSLTLSQVEKLIHDQLLATFVAICDELEKVCGGGGPSRVPRGVRSACALRWRRALGRWCWAGGFGGRGGRDALEGKGPGRRPQERLDRRLEEVAKAVGDGY